VTNKSIAAGSRVCKRANIMRVMAQGMRRRQL
jgi:hypothetical protein